MVRNLNPRTLIGARQDGGCGDPDQSGFKVAAHILASDLIIKPEQAPHHDNELYRLAFCPYSTPAMQRLIQRQAAAKRNVARRAARQAANLEIEKELQARQQLKAKTSMQALYFKNERERRRQVYEAGNLAPRYDVGEDVVKYATVDPYVMQGAARPWSEYKNDIFPFAEGDRVVITKGLDKGKIGRIITLDEKAGHVKVAGLNLVSLLCFLRHNHHQPSAITLNP